MSSFLNTLQARGMLQDVTPGTEAHLLQQPHAKAYIGVDPTAPSLHVGNLATFMLLKQFQLAGYTPIVLLGGATARVGDPSFRNEARPLIGEEELQYNQQQIQKQLTTLLQLEQGAQGLVVNNYAWCQSIPFLTFLREVGKHIPVGYMIGKEAIKTRVATGLSCAEFCYQLVQAYDFYHLHQEHGVTLQMGGSDQWGNITTGIALIRKKRRQQAFGLTTPLLTRTDGTKFGKTATGSNLWLDPAMTSPYAFYQFWLNSDDEDVPTLLRRMTLLSLPAIEALVQTHAQRPHERPLQHALAKELTNMVHGTQAYKEAAAGARLLFGQEEERAALHTLDEQSLLGLLSQVPHLSCDAHDLAQVPDLLTLLTTATGHAIFPSKREARQVVLGGGVRINKAKVQDPFQPLPARWLLDKYLLIQKGKKHHYLIERLPRDQ